MSKFLQAQFEVKHEGEPEVEHEEDMMKLN